MWSRTSGVRSYRSSATTNRAASASVSQGGSVFARILRGFVREVWSQVPPVRSIVRVLIRSRWRR